MKLEMTEGCTCFSYTVDGVEWIDLPIEKQRDICHKIIDNSTELQYIFRDYIYSHGEYEDLGMCECCGDCIENWKTEL